MKITIADIDKKVADAAAEKERLKSESRDADERRLELERQATAAAEAGELENYRALKKQAESISEESFVRAARLGKLSKPVSETEINSAWQDYEVGYSKALMSKLTEMKKAMDVFLDLYEKCVEMQSEALSVRKRLAGYSESNPDTLPMEFIPFQPQFERSPVTDCMAAFYLSQRKGERRPGVLMHDPVTAKVIAVVANRTAI